MNKAVTGGIILLLLVTHACAGEKYPQGKRLYTHYCSNCHMDDGSGLESLIPPLNGSEYLMSRVDTLPCIIRYGIEGRINVREQTYNQSMPGIPELRPVEIANIINYIRNKWGNAEAYISIQNVDEMLERCEDAEINSLK